MTRTTLTRAPEKASTDRDALNALIDDVRIGHFGLTAEDGHPLVIPAAIVRDGERILTHGSAGAGWRRRLAQGAPVCVTITALDGVKIGRSAFESGLHFRSAVLFGVCQVVDGEDKRRAIDLITEAFIPGRIAEVRAHKKKELAATQVLALPIAEWSLKISHAWPDDAPGDVAGDAWAGVVPLLTSHGAAIPVPDLRPGIPVPPSVRKLTDAG